MNIEEAKSLTPYQIEFLKLLREIRDAIENLREE